MTNHTHRGSRQDAAKKRREYMGKKATANVWLISPPLLIMVGMSIAVGIQFRQARLDRALVEAVWEQDAVKATRVLNDGANANAEDTGNEKQTLKEAVFLAWLRLTRQPTAHGRHALILSSLAGEPQAGKFVYHGDHAALVRTLLQHGADPNAIDRVSEETSLDVEVVFGKPDTVQALLEFGAKATLHNGYNPLVIAATSGRNDNARILLDHGADANARDEHGVTVLQAVAGGDHTAALSLLLDHGAKLEDIDNNGQTALMYAAVGEHKEAVRLLLQRGANASMEDTSGDTALELAMRGMDSDDKKAVIRMLEQAERQKETSP